ncbi:hypothetical protein [Arthrobacter sp. SLBN-53]|uniref:hypothetical protein n=1 Tax=Arthrobacter sp. SLBN-53 TaxID=2768412 RepID=UPI00114E97A0|nr:hypothetical protein [Arthrobacter sp. SLBN-53]TQK29391.1 hypothetical protein FBY28_2394 [Arthrobacter sp. SLBN-53]
MTTAIVAHTKARAEQLAHDLGIEDAIILSSRNAATLEGLRAERWLVDAAVPISDAALQVIFGTALKMPNGGAIVRYVNSVAPHGYPGR